MVLCLTEVGQVAGRPIIKHQRLIIAPLYQFNKLGKSKHSNMIVIKLLQKT